MLRYFIAVAEERHFGRAAERLSIARPPLSVTVSSLEREIGTPLLIRTTRRVEVTPAGELLARGGKRILEELDSLVNDVRRVGGGLEGTVRVGFTGSATYELMPRAVRAVAEAFPALDLVVTGEHLTPDLEARLLDRRVDIAVLRPPVLSTDLRSTVVADEPLVAAVRADTALAEHESLALDDLRDGPLIGYPEDSSIARTLAAAWGPGNTPAYVQRVPETSTLLSLVAAGMGSAVIPESATALRLDHVTYRPISDAPRTSLAVAWRDGDRSPAVLRLVAFLTDALRHREGEAP